MKRKHPKTTKAIHYGKPTLAMRYAHALQHHPIKTIGSGVLILSVLISAGFAAYYFTAYQAQVHPWQDTPEDSIGRVPPLAQWLDKPADIYGGGSVKVVKDDAKGKAVQFLATALPGQQLNSAQQALLTPKREVAKPGQTVWIGFDMRIAKGLNIANGVQSIMQVVPDTKGSPSLALTVNESTEGLSLRRYDGPTGTPAYYEPLGTLAYDTWTRIVIGMRIARGPDSSWIEAWQDGKPAILRKGWSSYNQAGDGHSGGLLYDNATSATFKFGIARNQPTGAMDVRLANIKIAGSRDAVQ